MTEEISEPMPPEAKQSIWLDKLQEWFYLTPGYNPLISRLAGLVGIAEGVKLWNVCYITAKPFIVPAWRVDFDMLYLYQPTQPVAGSFFALYFLACLYLIFGGRHKVAIGYIALIIAYFGSLDTSAISGHDRVIELTLLVSLLFDRGSLPRNPSRRLMQISVGLCYACSALQKMLFPDFVSGDALLCSLANPDALTEYSAPWTETLKSLPMWAWSLASCSAIATEFFIAFALFVKRLRPFVLPLAACFHGVLDLMFGEYVFAWVMWTGLLAFLDKPGEQEDEKRIKAEGLPGGAWRFDKAEFICVLSYLLIVVLVPLRIYFWIGRSPQTLNFADRCPWTFCMYLMSTHSDGVTVYLVEKDKPPRLLPLEGRMEHMSSDSAMIACADWIMREHPTFLTVKIYERLRIDNKWNQQKIYLVEKNDEGKVRRSLSVKND